MDGLLHRDDVPVDVMLNKALKDAISMKKESDYIKSLESK